MDPVSTITRADMADVALGGAFLGTGGGGDPYIGRLMAEQAIDANGPVAVLDIETLDDDALIVPVAMMGAPTVMLEKLPRGDEAVATGLAVASHRLIPAIALALVVATGSVEAAAPPRTGPPTFVAHVVVPSC